VADASEVPEVLEVSELLEMCELPRPPGAAAGSLGTARFCTSSGEGPPKSTAATSPRYSAMALAETIANDEATSTAQRPVTRRLPAVVRGSGLVVNRGRSSGGPCDRRSLNRGSLPGRG
jgi:hypothetical protein